MEEENILRAGFEPATYGFLLRFQLQSTALPTELSKEACTRTYTGTCTHVQGA